MAQAEGRIEDLGVSGCVGRFDRCFADAETMTRFVQTLDAVLADAQVLKDDVPSLVGRVRWNGQDVVVKRYNYRGLWHSLRHTLKGSRAKRNWRGARRLLSLQIGTPQPLAYVDRYRGPLLWQSYYVARFVSGPHLRQVWQDQSVSDDEKQRLHNRVLEALDQMARHGVSHGDMKHTNILCQETDIMLTDLDAMCVDGAGWLHRFRCWKDLKRYRRDLAALTTVFQPSPGTGSPRRAARRSRLPT
jgi:tRNA A-37 threonylcarbamoyl transferase component Bud32